MTEGYVICRNKECSGILDEELSKILGLFVYWVERRPSDEMLKKYDGKFFDLDEVIFAGLKDLADKLGFQKYLKER
jgi:hypothetical protein